MRTQPVRIIPCLDMNEGRVVKGVQFESLRDAGDPVEIAQRYEGEGADELVLLDITATTQNRGTSLDALRRIRAVTSIPLCMGGGFSTLEGIGEALAAGADSVGINSAAVRDPDFLKRACKAYPGRITLAIDVLGDEASGWRVVIDGGRTDTGIELGAWAAQAAACGVSQLLLTSKTADGTKAGYDIGATRLAARASGLPVIASGGAGALEHFAQAARDGEADGLLAASLFHFRELTVPMVKNFLAEQNIPVYGAYLPDLSVLQWNEAGLIPAIAQDADSGEVLMLAWMSRESLRLTADSGYATYYSRSRREIWRKGDTSGHVQRVLRIRYDCDADCLLLTVRQTGAACHTGARSCFFEPLLTLSRDAGAQAGPVICEVDGVIHDRRDHPKPGSYTNYLLDKGVEKIGKKVGEEATEVVIAAMKGNRDELTYEAADLIYHLLVMLCERGVPVADVMRELRRRR